MKLKITTTKSQEKTGIPSDDIKPGIVFKYGIYGPTALKLRHNKVLLLTYSIGGNWFELNDGSFSNTDIITLGCLNEIIVVEE